MNADPFQGRITPPFDGRLRAGKPPARHGLLVALLLFFLASSAPLWADNSPLLRVESASGHSGQQLPLGHPAALSEDGLAELLGQLEYRQTVLFGRESSRKVFTGDEISVLAPRLVEALAQAGSTEQVRFASFSRRSGALGQLLKTEAIAFVDSQGSFNLAFSGIHEFAGPDQDYFDFLALGDHDALAIDRHLLRLDGFEAWTMRDDRPLWAFAELPAQAATNQPPAAARPPSPQTTAAGEPAVAPPPAPTPPGAPGGESEDTLDQTMEQQVRQRLEFLKGLYEDGLITEQEYEQQRRAALRGLDHPRP